LRSAHSRGHQFVTDIRRLQPFRYLHDCSDCFRRERIAGWDLHPLESAALSRRTPQADLGSGMEPRRAPAFPPPSTATDTTISAHQGGWTLWLFNHGADMARALKAPTPLPVPTSSRLAASLPHNTRMSRCRRTQHGQHVAAVINQLLQLAGSRWSTCNAMD